MTKVAIIILALSLTAASCNLLGGNSGVKGVLVSEDAGRSFHASNQINEKNTINNISVNTLVFDSQNPETMYLGASNGIYKTTDNAKTWQQILTGLAVTDIASDPLQSNLIYASGLAGRNGKIIKSPDGGGNWEDIYTEPSRSNPVIALDISKTNNRVIVAGLNSGEIIRSTDQGQSWAVAQDLQDLVLQVQFVDGSTAYALTSTKGLSKSTDQGQTWTQLSISPTITSGVQQFGAGRRYLDAAFDPNSSSTIYVANEQGLIRTTDGGNTWSVMYLPVRDSSLRVSSVSVSANNSSTIYAVIGSTMFKTTNRGETWETIKLPSNQTVHQVLVHPQAANVIYLGLGD